MKFDQTNIFKFLSIELIVKLGITKRMQIVKKDIIYNVVSRTV